MSIDITPFQERLELLREWMFLRIDYPDIEVWLDLQVCPDDYYIRNNLPIPKPRKEIMKFVTPDFEKFLKHKGYEATQA